ncbi:MAG: VCBS repeat-containing protein [Planctomycetes bacterium]|jgi:hypothetical protein|nr:VCBS repeat-containing protein [Planctomycetota bacterium]
MRRGIMGLLVTTLAALATGGAAPVVDVVWLRSHAGDASSDYFGSRLSCHGDFNGDGYADLAVYESDAGATEPGMVRVFSGEDGTELWFVRGSGASDHYGQRGVTFLSDLDGDGCDELAIAGDRDANWTGRVDVFSGRTRNKLFTFKGDTAGDKLGNALAAAGDVNGDGIEDILAIAPGVYQDAVRTGRLRIYSGADGSVLLELYGFAEERQVAGAGDVDADGYDDFVVASPSEAAAGSYAGAVRVYSGLDGALLHLLTGDDDQDYFGYSVVGLGDVDGDGCDDLAIGACGDEADGVATGAVHIHSGRTGGRMASLHGDELNDYFGYSLATLGDFDLDGVPDLVVGIRGSDDAAAQAGQARVYSGADWSVRAVLDGEGVNMLFGDKVAAGGDLNGDSIPDFVVHSAGYAPSGKTAAGKVDVYVSTCPEGHLAIDDGAECTGSREVGLWLVRPNITWTEARARNSDGSWSDWSPFLSRLPFLLSEGEGEKVVEAELRNSLGTVLGPVRDEIHLDLTSPTGTLAIDGGKAYTRQRGVTLFFSATDDRAGVGGLRLRNGGDSFGLWRPYSDSRLWVIGEVDGLHTVEVQYRDLVGNVSNAYSAMVNLDTAAPAGSFAVNGGRGYLLGGEAVVLDVMAADGPGGSGLDGLGVSFDDGLHWSAWMPFGASGPVELPAPGSEGSRVVKARIRDRAGNDTTIGAKPTYFLGSGLPVLGPNAKHTGPVAAAVCVQAFTVGFVKGDLLSAKVKTKAEGAGGCGVFLDVLAPDRTRVVTERYPATLPAPGIAAFPAPETGEYTLVVRAIDGIATSPGTYSLALKVKPAKANRGRTATLSGEPLLFDAPRGALLSASLKGAGLTAAMVSLSGPSGPIAFLAKEGKGTVAFRAVALDQGTGTYRLETSAPGPVVVKISVKLPR